MITSLRKHTIILRPDYNIHTLLHTLLQNLLIQTLPYTEVGSRRGLLWKTKFFFLFRYCVWQIASFLAQAHQCIFQSKCYKFCDIMFIHLQSTQQSWMPFILRFYLRSSSSCLSINMLAFCNIFSTFENRAIAYFDVCLHRGKKIAFKRNIC